MLLVDEHKDSRQMYAISLQELNLEPLVAETADDAFACACVSHPDVVVAAVNHAGDEAFNLARRLRDDRRTKEAGIIVLTGYVSLSLARAATDAGCDRFLLKPCAPDTLAFEIRHVLSQRAVSGVADDAQGVGA